MGVIKFNLTEWFLIKSINQSIYKSIKIRDGRKRYWFMYREIKKLFPKCLCKETWQEILRDIRSGLGIKHWVAFHG